MFYKGSSPCKIVRPLKTKSNSLNLGPTHRTLKHISNTLKGLHKHYV